MIRYLATLAVACLALLGFAGYATAQTQSVGSALFELFKPFVVEAVGVLLSAVVLWLATTLKAKLNIDIDAKHREALQAALTNAAGLVINRAGGMAGALALPSANPLIIEGVDYVVKSAPEAIKHFGITPEAVGAVLTEKLEAKIGVMVSTGAAAQA